MKFFATLALWLAIIPLCAQLNATLVSNFDYEEAVNDVWGYVAPDGTEYALIGLDNGVSVVSLADPRQPVEVGRTTGANSPWRDLKTYGGFAYVTADRGQDGLTVIDLRHLPESISFTNEIYEVPGFATPFLRAHNIYIDTLAGLAFTAGGDGNVNRGGVLIFDLNANPERPPLVAVGPEIYAHDVYVRDSMMYNSEINDGQLSIYDFRDLDNITLVGRTATPSTFTHNAWLSDDANFVYTTDEVGNAPVAAFDISDPSNPELVDEYRPLNSLNTGTIPHNVHVIDDYLSVSYYTDGLTVADASDPTNIIEVANWDTWPGASGGFNGAWGAYPFLPSGLTLVSDRQTGLYVVDVNYKRAARLRGAITEQGSGTAINGASVVIDSEQLNEGITDPLGRYATGIADGGTYQVTVSAPGYRSFTTTIALVNGQTQEFNAELSLLATFNPTVSVVDEDSGQPIGEAVLALSNENQEYAGRTEANGNLTLEEVFDYDYEVVVTAWGYRARTFASLPASQLDGTTFRLERGYEDDFVSDLGWTITGTASDGAWALGTPGTTQGNGTILQPGFDAPNDLGERCYFTGLAGGSTGQDDVDNGTTILTSPVFDPRDILTPRLSYQYWFANASGATLLNDTLRVAISNGTDTVVLAEYTGLNNEWTSDEVLLEDFIDLTGAMQLIVTTADQEERGHIVEAGFDNFAITEGRSTSTEEELPTAAIDLQIFPNPTPATFTINYDFGDYQGVHLRLIGIDGRLIGEFPLVKRIGSLQLGESLKPGMYIADFRHAGGRLQVARLIKQ